MRSISTNAACTADIRGFESRRPPLRLLPSILSPPLARLYKVYAICSKRASPSRRFFLRIVRVSEQHIAPQNHLAGGAKRRARRAIDACRRARRRGGERVRGGLREEGRSAASARAAR